MTKYIRRPLWTRPLFVLFFLLATLLSPSETHAQLQPQAVYRLRVGVKADGLVVITPPNLAAAGVDLASINPQTFALSSRGQPVAIRVTGEADGRFDAGDRLIFFGQRFTGPEMEQKYTDELVYWLDIGGAPGQRVPDVAAAPQGNLTPLADFPDTLRAEESRLWWTLNTLYMDTQDTWFWERLQPITPQPATALLAVTVPDPAPGHAAQLRLEKIARNFSSTVNPDHRTTIAVNGVPVLDNTWDGKVRRVFSAGVPAGTLLNGTNNVTVSALVQPGLVVDDVYVNYVELDYRRLFRAWAGQLDFTAETSGAHEYLVSGWANDQVEIWDVSNPAAPRRLTGATAESVGSQIRLRFRTEDVLGARYWLQATSALNAPASLRLRPPTGLRQPAGGADVVIVTDESLLAEAQSLAGWHSARGRRPLVAFFRDVTDEFNDGIYHPQAVPAMLSWAQTHWDGPAPAYLTLLGDGHWNFKGYNPAAYPNDPNLIPPYLAWVDPWQGEVPADALFGDLNGDQTPDLAIGRIPAATPAEARIMVDKIIAYDETTRRAPWQRRALFVADNADSAGDFPLLSDEIINGYLPPDLAAQKVYLGAPSVPDASAARAAINAAIQSGVFMVQYTGHGAVDSWAHESIWSTIDISGLSNGSRLPVVLTFNCLDGYFAYPGRPSMAEVMLRRAGGGSIAAISPSGLGLAVDQQNLRKLLMARLADRNARELGRALMLAKQDYQSRYGSNYLLATMTLYGDPAMRLPQGEQKLYLPLIRRGN